MFKRLFFLAALQAPMLAIAVEECPTGGAQCWEMVAKKHETGLQAKYPGMIQRKGDTLIIRSASGKINTFKNNRSDDGSEPFIIYNAWGALPNLDWVVLRVGYIEGGAHVLVSLSSGHVLEANGHGGPVLSPDSKRLMMFSQDMDAGYNDNYIAIYQIDKNNAKLEISLSGDRKMSPSGSINYEDDFWGPSKPRWVDNETVTYDEDRNVGGGNIQSTHIELKYINGKWQKNITGKSPVVKNN